MQDSLIVRDLILHTHIIARIDSNPINTIQDTINVQLVLASSFNLELSNWSTFIRYF